jgi:Zn-dependent M16 (insulinase) family peptidase
MALRELNKNLTQMSKTEIIKLILEMYKKIPDAKNYLDIFTTGDIEQLTGKYKKEIEKYIYPNGKNMVLRETEARKIIRTVRKMNITELNIELELHYVSCCLEIIEDFGYWDENYYIALGKIFNNAINGISELGVEDKYNEKVISLSSKASEYGIELEY